MDLLSRADGKAESRLSCALGQFSWVASPGRRQNYWHLFCPKAPHPSFPSLGLPEGRKPQTLMLMVGEGSPKGFVEGEIKT